MKKIAVRIWPLITCIIIVSLLSALAVNQFVIQNINSDFLYGYEIATNLLQHHFQGQDFPLAPYYFPDLLLIMLLNLVSSNITVLNFIYSLIFLFAFSVLTYNLLRSTQLTVSLAILGVLIALISFFFIIPPGMPLIQEWPFSHLSIMLFSLYLLNDSIQNRSRPCSNLRLSVNALLIYIIFISDNLLFAQLLAPLSIFIIFDLLQGKSNQKFGYSLLAIFLLTTIISAKTPDVLIKFFGASFSYHVSLFRIKNVMHLDAVFSHAFSLLSEHVRANSLFYMMILLYHALTLVLFVMLYIRNKGLKGIENLVRIISFLYLAQLINFLLAITVGKIVETAHFRYLDILYIYPEIALALCFVHLLQQKSDKPFLYGLLATLLTNCTAIFIYENHSLLTNIRFEPPYNATLQCMDDLQKKYALHNGVSEYWNVRTVRMLSKTHLHVSQINSQLNFTNFIDNQTHFYADAEHKIPFHYQFIITNHLSSDAILKNIGKPDQIAQCQGTEVWLYLTSASQYKLNQYFLSKLHSFSKETL